MSADADVHEQQRQLQRLQQQRELYQQRREQLLMVVQSQQQHHHRNHVASPPPQHQHEMLTPQQDRSITPNSAVAIVIPAITSLQDALSYPEQAPQVGPVRRRSLTPSAINNSRRDRKRSTPTARKKFPPGLARLRDRLQYLEDRLRLDVNTLRQEISDLELQRSLIATRALTMRFDATGSAAKVVREYFVMFRNGFQRFPPDDSVELRTARMLHACSGANADAAMRTALLPAPLRALQSQHDVASRQQAFLNARVDPFMAFHRYIGRDVLAEQWQRYTQCHAGLRLELLTLEVAAVSSPLERTDLSAAGVAGADSSDDATAAVRTTGRLTAYVTHDTLARIFPHVLRNAALAQQLLGAFIEYPFRIEFHVSAAGMITKYDAELDFVSALNRVLGNLDAVSLLMHGAVISDYCLIGDLDGVPQSPRDVTATAAMVVEETVRDTCDSIEKQLAPPVLNSSDAAKSSISYLLS